MKSFQITITLISFFYIILSGCDEILTEDISDKVVVIISPFNNSVLSNNNVRFLWEPVEGATSYHLQIVEPVFDQAEGFLIDTTTSQNSYIISLPPGNYEWRLLGSNDYYTTEYKYYKFRIEFEVDIN